MIKYNKILKHTLILIYFSIIFNIILINCIDYVPCPVSNHIETRELYVATCDTRTAWKEFHALKVWNVTGFAYLSIYLFIN